MAMICSLCPRRCHARRDLLAGEGRCRMGTNPVVARAAAHFWEEPCISGTKGSGTVFFSGCALGCAFCQNHSITKAALGQAMSPRQLAQLFLRVEALGVHNLNLVTPTHFASAVIEALHIYRPSVPVVWNSGGYETVEMVESLKGLVDIYLPDCKFFTRETGALLADAPDYFEVASKALAAMRAQTGAPVYDENGLMLRGTLVRHLILPGLGSESIAILDYIKENLPSTPVSLMRQYTPIPDIRVPGFDRRITKREYDRVLSHMLSLGLDGYLQGKEAADGAFTPDFIDEESVKLFPDAEA